jgi:site-specific DNA recombinase
MECALMKKRQRIGGSMTAKNVYLLSNKVTCGQCEANYFGESYKSRGNKYAYYKCSGKCGKKGVAKQALEKAVIEALLKVCFSP